MGILQRLFGKKNSEATEHASTKSAQTESEWEKLEAFVPVEAEEAKHVSIIAAAIAASDYPESQFVVKRVPLNATQKQDYLGYCPQRLLQVNQATVNGLLKKSTKNANHNLF